MKQIILTVCMTMALVVTTNAQTIINNSTNTISALAGTTTTQSISTSDIYDKKVSDFLMSGIDKTIKYPKEFNSVKKEYDAMVKSTIKLEDSKEKSMEYVFGFSKENINNKKDVEIQLAKINSFIKQLQDNKRSSDKVSAVFESKFDKSNIDEELKNRVNSTLSMMDSVDSERLNSEEYRALLEMNYQLKSFILKLQSEKSRYTTINGTLLIESPYLNVEYADTITNIRNQFKLLVLATLNNDKIILKDRAKAVSVFGEKIVASKESEVIEFNDLVNKWNGLASVQFATSTIAKTDSNDELERRLKSDPVFTDLASKINTLAATDTYNSNVSFTSVKLNDKDSILNHYNNSVELGGLGLKLYSSIYNTVLQYMKDYPVPGNDVLETI